MKDKAAAPKREDHIHKEKLERKEGGKGSITEDYRRKKWKRLRIEKTIPENSEKSTTNPKLGVDNKDYEEQNLDDLVRNIKINKHKYTGNVNNQDMQEKRLKQRIGTKKTGKNVKKLKKSIQNVKANQAHGQTVNLNCEHSNSKFKTCKLICFKSRKRNTTKCESTTTEIPTKSRSTATTYLKNESCQTKKVPRKTQSCQTRQCTKNKCSGPSKLERSWSLIHIPTCPEEKEIISQQKDIRPRKKENDSPGKNNLCHTCWRQEQNVKHGRAHTDNSSQENIQGKNIKQKSSTQTVYSSEIYITCCGSQDSINGTTSDKRTIRSRKAMYRCCEERRDNRKWQKKKTVDLKREKNDSGAISGMTDNTEEEFEEQVKENGSEEQIHAVSVRHNFVKFIMINSKNFFCQFIQETNDHDQALTAENRTSSKQTSGTREKCDQSVLSTSEIPGDTINPLVKHESDEISELIAVDDFKLEKNDQPDLENEEIFNKKGNESPSDETKSNNCNILSNPVGFRINVQALISKFQEKNIGERIKECEKCLKIQTNKVNMYQKSMIRDTSHIKLDYKYFPIIKKPRLSGTESNNVFLRRTYSDYVWKIYNALMAGDKMVFDKHFLKRSEQKSRSLTALDEKMAGNKSQTKEIVKSMLHQSYESKVQKNIENEELDVKGQGNVTIRGSSKDEIQVVEDTSGKQLPQSACEKSLQVEESLLAAELPKGNGKKVTTQVEKSNLKVRQEYDQGEIKVRDNITYLKEESCKEISKADISITEQPEDNHSKRVHEGKTITKLKEVISDHEESELKSNITELKGDLEKSNIKLAEDNKDGNIKLVKSIKELRGENNHEVKECKIKLEDGKEQVAHSIRELQNESNKEGIVIEESEVNLHEGKKQDNIKVEVSKTKRADIKDKEEIEEINRKLIDVNEKGNTVTQTIAESLEENDKEEMQVEEIINIHKEDNTQLKGAINLPGEDDHVEIEAEVCKIQISIESSTEEIKGENSKARLPDEMQVLVDGNSILKENESNNEKFAEDNKQGNMEEKGTELRKDDEQNIILKISYKENGEKKIHVQASNNNLLEKGNSEVQESSTIHEEQINIKLEKSSMELPEEIGKKKEGTITTNQLEENIMGNTNVAENNIKIRKDDEQANIELEKSHKELPKERGEGSIPEVLKASGINLFKVNVQGNIHVKESNKTLEVYQEVHEKDSNRNLPEENGQRHIEEKELNSELTKYNGKAIQMTTSTIKLELETSEKTPIEKTQQMMKKKIERLNELEQKIDNICSLMTCLSPKQSAWKINKIVFKASSQIIRSQSTCGLSVELERTESSDILSELIAESKENLVKMFLKSTPFLEFERFQRECELMTESFTHFQDA